MRSCSQRASIFGSFCGRLAFMGKAVLGRLMVAFSSKGTLVSFSQMIESLHYREPRQERLCERLCAIPDAPQFESSAATARTTAPRELGNTLRKPLRKEVQFYIEAKARDVFPVPGGRPGPILETKSSNRQLVGKTAHLCRWGTAKKLADSTALPCSVEAGNNGIIRSQSESSQRA